MTNREKIIEYLKKKARKGERIINCINVATDLNVNYDLVHKTLDELIEDGSIRELKV